MGRGFPSAKLGMVAVVSNTTVARMSKSFFTVFLLWEESSGELCTVVLAGERKRRVEQVFGKSKFLGKDVHFWGLVD
jgi:hypothetical protein